jgi:hypothetical protein
MLDHAAPVSAIAVAPAPRSEAATFLAPFDDRLDEVCGRTSARSRQDAIAQQHAEQDAKRITVSALRM